MKNQVLISDKLAATYPPLYTIQLKERISPWNKALLRLFNNVGLKSENSLTDEIPLLLKQHKHIFFISITTSYSTKIRLDRLIRESLIDPIEKGNCQLFHFSSLGREQLLNGKKAPAHYHFYKLPMHIDKIYKEILSKYLDSVLKNDRWPGGRSSRPSQFLSELKKVF